MTDDQTEQSRRTEAYLGALDALKQRRWGVDMGPFCIGQALRKRAWEGPRTSVMGRTLPPCSFHDFIHEREQVGLGSTYAEVEAIIRHDDELVAIYEAASGRTVDRAPLAALSAAQLLASAEALVGAERHHLRERMARGLAVSELLDTITRLSADDQAKLRKSWDANNEAKAKREADHAAWLASRSAPKPKAPRAPKPKAPPLLAEGQTSIFDYPTK